MKQVRNQVSNFVKTFQASSHKEQRLNVYVFPVHAVLF
jgi:hypothetical protein